EHNHRMEPDVALYAPKYRKLTPEIMEEIEFYVTKGNMGSKQIFPLLTAKFHDYTIHKPDLYNAIQKFRTTPSKRHQEAQRFVENLLQLKNEDSESFCIHEIAHSRKIFIGIGDYLNRMLQGCIRLWARCYQLKFFTAGIQSTQRVEVMNRLIKEGVKRTSS
ncbi:6770_t:CDS:2, partial [Gigaspora rosea]